MKKHLKWLFLPFLIAVLLLSFSCKQGQDPTPETKHTHSWGSPVVTKEATCTEKGEKTYTCSSCGETKVASIPATGHSYSKEWTTEEGSGFHWHETTCGHEAKGSYEPHTWDSSEVIKESSCTEEGIRRYTCKCGATKDEPIPMHSFASTWTSDDTHHWHAATCGHDAVSDKAEHVWGSYVKNSDGKTATFTCKICKKTVTRDLPKVFSMVNTGPGEDASNSAVISWHSTSTGSYLEYTDANGDSFVNTVVNTDCGETLSTADWRDTSGNKLTSSHYRCKVYLNNLSPDSTYKYRIKDNNGNCSEIATFRTAESDSTYFQFMWLSDNHVPKGGKTTLERVRELVNFAQDKPGVDLDFVLFTGDMVNKGQIYEHWNYWSDSGLMNDLTYSFVCGNHDYYGWNDKERTTNDYYKEFAAYPANNTTEVGKDVLDSNYWFIWNRVLFVCVDNFTIESEVLQNLSGASLSAQQAWFKAVVDANKGNYDYLIFCQHLPWFNTDTKACEYGYYSNWYRIFDEYKVDFALSSDEHHYRRTYPLFNNKNPNYTNAKNPNVEKAERVDGVVTKGTVYVTSNLTEGSSLSSLSNSASSGLSYIEYSAGGVGGVYFTVTPERMTLHLIGSGGREYDTITVAKKSRD